MTNEPKSPLANEGQSTEEASASSEKNVETLFEYVAMFYESKKNTTKRQNESARLISAVNSFLTQEEVEKLCRLAKSTDEDYSRTLNLSEAIVVNLSEENGIKQRALDFIGDSINYSLFPEEPISNIFENWLKESDASRAKRKIEFFAQKIGQISKKKLAKIKIEEDDQYKSDHAKASASKENQTEHENKEKRLPIKEQNCLASIGAMWLYHKKQGSIEELIRHLTTGPLYSQDQESAAVHDSAFAYLAKSIKSPNKQGLSFLLKIVNNRLAEHTNVVAQNARLITHRDNLSSQLENLQIECRELDRRLNEAQMHLETESVKAKSLQNQLDATERYRTGDVKSANNSFNFKLQKLAETLQLAETALGRARYDAVKSQLDEMQRQIEEGQS